MRHQWSRDPANPRTIRFWGPFERSFDTFKPPYGGLRLNGFTLTAQPKMGFQARGIHDMVQGQNVIFVDLSFHRATGTMQLDASWLRNLTTVDYYSYGRIVTYHILDAEMVWLYRGQENLDNFTLYFDEDQYHALNIWLDEMEQDMGGFAGMKNIRGNALTEKHVTHAFKKLQRKAEKCGFTKDALAQGMKAELEHKDVTKGSVLKTARIAAAHLCERTDYYELLEKYVEGGKKKR